MNPKTAAQINNLVQKVRHYLMTMMGRSLEKASPNEFYRALSLALREEIMINWTASSSTIRRKKSRTIYYLSMEYMPGRCLRNNIINIGALDLVQAALQKMGRTLEGISTVERDIGIGNGGLGRLASCFLDSLATGNYPAVGYGMRYQYGIFEQEIWCGVQVERPDCWLLTDNPWEFRRDDHTATVQFSGHVREAKSDAGETIYHLSDSEEVRALPYDLPIIGYGEGSNFFVTPLRLWSTKDSPHNFKLQRFNAGHLDQAAENTALTDVLYPNDNNEAGKRMRLKQEFLLVSASLQDIINRHKALHHDLSSFADLARIQINDTHPALAIAELMRILITDHHYSWNKAWETTQECCSYTNHTVLKEALEEWNEIRVKNLLPRQYHIIQRLNQELCDAVRQKYPGDEERLRRMSCIEQGQIRMANLAIFGSHKVNGVAKLHTEILEKSLFKDFYEMFPERFVNVTNGVTQRRWLLSCNPLLSEFITKRIGKEWITDFSQIAKLNSFASDQNSLIELLSIKKSNKERYLTHLQEKMTSSQWNCPGEAAKALLCSDALFDVQIKRIHEYKRQLMNALHAIMLYQEIKENPSANRAPRMILIGGKAAPGYEAAKNIIRLIYCLSRKINNDPAMDGKLRVIFIENYNVSEAELIIPAADLSEQISTAGMEASGTGNMKLSINGALTIGTNDGANVEMRESVGDAYWPFRFGCSAEENAEVSWHNSYDPSMICTQQPLVKKALDALIDGSFTENDAEHAALTQLHASLLESQYGGHPDRFFVVKELLTYYETQKKVDALYKEPLKWAEYVIHNIAGMGPLSADVSIKNYAEKIWNIEPCLLDLTDLERIREEYSEIDQYRVLF